MSAATDGCTTCGSQATVLLHPQEGRQCPTHITLPDGPYRPDLAMDMVAMGRVDAAFTYIRACLDREIDRRFDALLADMRAGWEAADTARRSVAA